MIENVDALTSLESLFLGKNKITKLQNLDALTNLTVLSMQVRTARSLLPRGPPGQGFASTASMLGSLASLSEEGETSHCTDLAHVTHAGLRFLP